ncbi:1-phosphofructokinase [Azospirillum sp. RWY-5-1]|uniref:Phosphofructokinase n=1 Tax=Azospirillum oleiclasticum TaxID=2735135 RepID=A0ABX2TA05_9PROT|nr:1-phosphofructokinase [Azospirillum oleiclasticum]NYZ12823.1 1-phosphofructokinase [Azospirillum oleiclasticum]NYZ19983.1 1-phosphofructokinase [Azospirillum oleiclasticum]
MTGVVTVTLNAAVDQTLDVPGFTAGAVNRALSETRTAGGKGINVAAFLSGGPAPVTAIGFLGADNTAVFETLFRDRRIADRCLRVPGSSRTNVKVVDREGGSVTDINLPGPRIPDTAWRALLDGLDELGALNGVFVLAGSVPAGLTDSAYAEIIPVLRRHGAFVTLDASGAPLRHAMAAKPDMIKPNAHELSELLGRPLGGRDDVTAAARELAAQGVALVVVSLGADGAVFVERGRALHAQPPRVEVASTVGAGDAMVAGVLAARLAGGDLEDCARRGTAYAAGTLSLLGPELPPPPRIAELMAGVRIEAIE